MAMVAIVVAGVFVAHAASASSSVATNDASGTAAATGSGNSTASHTCPNMTNTTASGTTSRGNWP